MFLLFTFVCSAFLKFSIYSAWYSWGFCSLWFYLYTSTVILSPFYSRHFNCTYIMQNEVCYFTWMEISPANSPLYRIWEDSMVFILSKNVVRIQIMSYRPITPQSTCSSLATGYCLQNSVLVSLSSYQLTFSILIILYVQILLWNQLRILFSNYLMNYSIPN